MGEEAYISNQIVVSKNSKVLVELLDKLQPAPLERYASIHARGTVDESGIKKYSNIGVRIKDYSAGTGVNSITVDANITPEEAMFFLSRVNAGFQTFDWSSQKIFGDPDQQGNSQVTILTVKRIPTNAKGEVRNYPWIIECQNGVGIAAHKENGGTYCKSGTYQKCYGAGVNLNDYEFFRLFYRAKQYIEAWEAVWAPHLLREGKTALQARLEARRTEMAQAG